MVRAAGLEVVECRHWNALFVAPYWAAYRLLRLPRMALAPLDRAVALATEVGDPSLAVLPLVTRAGANLSLGEKDAALQDIALAERHATMIDAGPVYVQKAIIYLRLGQPREALAASTSAIRHLRRNGDHQSLATALMNRGLVRTYLELLPAGDQRAGSEPDTAATV